MSDFTQSYYHQRIQEILRYIDEHLDADLRVEKLAQHAGISYYHFHRIMHACLDESLGSYINKKRLETSLRLLRYSSMLLEEVAIKIGYADISAFSKAFQREFGLTPSQYRTQKDIELNTHIDFRIGENSRIIGMLKPKMITLPDMPVYYIEVIGRYGGNEVEKAWDELLKVAKTEKRIGWKTEYLSIYYDDPDLVGAENCRSDLCLISPRKNKAESQLKSKLISGGHFAVFRYKGPYDRLWELYESIYSYWLFTTNFMLRDAPIMEKYLNYNPRRPENEFITEIYIPIEVKN